jgi:hypothetical protein
MIFTLNQRFSLFSCLGLRYSERFQNPETKLKYPKAVYFFTRFRSLLLPDLGEKKPEFEYSRLASETGQ